MIGKQTQVFNLDDVIAGFVEGLVLPPNTQTVHHEYNIDPVKGKLFLTLTVNDETELLTLREASLMDPS